MPNQDERRRRRSDNKTLALHYQLDASRTLAGLDALVLSDEDGICLAVSGDSDACQEVAARLPFIGRKVPEFEGVLLGPDAGWRIRMERIAIAGSQLYLCAIGKGGPRRNSQMVRSQGAVRRIIEAAA